MSITNIAAGTNVHEIADDGYRINTPVDLVPGGFSCKRSVKWLDAPHLPHGWETGFLMDTRTSTLFCGDLFTQGGRGAAALTTQDILDSSEAFRQPMDYFSHTTNTTRLIEHLAAESPATLACMHGSAWSGDGAKLLRALGARLVGS